MNRILPIFILLFLGCNTPCKEKTPELTVEQLLEKKGELHDLRRRAVIAHLGLMGEGIIKTDWDPVNSLVARSTPENIEGRLRILVDDYEDQLNLHRSYGNAAKAAVQYLEQQGK